MAPLPLDDARLRLATDAAAAAAEATLLSPSLVSSCWTSWVNKVSSGDVYKPMNHE
jgi:hypothetical protein